MQIISLVIYIIVSTERNKEFNSKKMFEVHLCRNDTHFKLYYYF